MMEKECEYLGYTPCLKSAVLREVAGQNWQGVVKKFYVCPKHQVDLFSKMAKYQVRFLHSKIVT
jgi:hypothetical protein